MTTTTRFLREITKTSGDIWEKGWAERNAGNISVRLRPDEVAAAGIANPDSPWQTLSMAIPEIRDDLFLISGTGKYIRNIPLEPERNLGIIRLDATGSQYQVIWGFADGGKPTSELAAHLRAHAVKKTANPGAGQAVIHTHPTNLIALTYALDLDTDSLTRLLWEMHGECIVVFPEGVEYLPWMMAGTDQIGAATALAFERRNLVVWQYHGIFGAGQDLDTAFGLIDTAEKAAEIYIKTAAVGGVRHKLPLEKLYAIARNYGAEPAADIVERLRD